MWLVISFLAYRTLEGGRECACEFHHPNCWTPSLGLLFCHYFQCVGDEALRQHSPTTFLAPGTGFVEGDFSTDGGGRGGGDRSGGNASVGE